jgi:hypothetical protein
MRIMSLVIAGAATLMLAVASVAEAQVIRDHRGGYQPYKGHGSSPTTNCPGGILVYTTPKGIRDRRPSC